MKARSRCQLARLVCATSALALVGLVAFAVPAATAQANKKVTLGIGEIQTSIGGADPESFGTMLETQLVKTNKFNIIERSRLVEILKEKGLSMAGVTDGSGKLSGIEGVDYLIYGSITKLGKAGKDFSYGGFGIANSKVEMAVDLRVVNASNGEMLYADTVQETVEGSTSLAMRGMNSDNSAGDPLADVQRLTAKAITGRIVTSIYPIKVIAVEDDGTVVVNYGDSLLTVGDQLKIFQLGESFRDPDTGQVLGSEEKQVGLLEVTEADPRFSKAKIVSGAAKVGNIARRLSSSASDKHADTPHNQLPGE